LREDAGPKRTSRDFDKKWDFLETNKVWEIWTLGGAGSTNSIGIFFAASKGLSLQRRYIGHRDFDPVKKALHLGC
jgi:hypothetical protein